MTPELTLIAGTAVDWNRFVSNANCALGRSPTKELDRCELPAGTPSSYVAALAEFARPGSNPVTSLRDSDKVLDHLHYSFLAAVDRDTALAVLKQSSGLAVLAAEPTKGRENLILTGSLRDWRTAVVEGCAPSACPDARVFYNAVWQLFDRMGFREAFGRCHRRDLKDTTFALEAKRQ
jgi:hypothetical protein